MLVNFDSEITPKSKVEDSKIDEKDQFRGQGSKIDELSHLAEDEVSSPEREEK